MRKFKISLVAGILAASSLGVAAPSASAVPISPSPTHITRSWNGSARHWKGARTWHGKVWRTYIGKTR